MSKFRSWIGARPYWISLVMLLAVAAWMGSGYPYQAQAEQTPQVDADDESLPLTRVQVRAFQSQPIEQSLELYGRSEAFHQSILGAEISGRLVEFVVSPGAWVRKGQTIARLATNNRQFQLESAKAHLTQREIEYQGAKALNQKGFQGKAALARAKSDLVGAQASVKQLQLDLNNTNILAPYDGVFSDNIAEPGDFLGIGDPILQFADTSKLIISADVSERHIAHLKLGQQVTVNLVTGESLTGSLHFIAAVSNPATNTFRVEVLVANPDRQLKAGISAELSFPLALRNAIKVTPAALAIADDGTLGIKLVKDGEVIFKAAELLRSEDDGAWLGGFEGEVNVITLGQGFVSDGERVEVVWEK